MPDVAKVKRNVKRMLDDGATEKEVDSYLSTEGIGAESLRQSVPMEQQIDVEAGAPAIVRASVGPGYRKPQDRLATLQRAYPDAAPYGEDNYVFTDPKTGQPTLYNPKGMDVGDVAEYGRAIPEMAGGAAGAVAGMYSGNPLMIPIGAGLGTEAAGELYDWSMEQFGGRADTRTLLHRGLDSTTGVLGAAAGQKLGAEIPNAFNRMIGATRNRLAGATGREILGTYKGEGIPVEGAAGAITGSRSIQGVEHALAKLPTSARTMGEAADQTLGKVEALARNLIPGKARTAEQGGRALQKGLKGFVDRFQLKAGQLYNALDNFVPGTDPVPLNNTMGALKKPIEKFANTPHIAKSLLPAKFQGYLDDMVANNGRLSWEQVKEFRSFVGKMQNDPRIISDIPTSQWKQLYGALSQDMESMIKALPPAARKGAEFAFKRANKFYSAGSTRIEFIEKIIKNPETEKAFQAVFSGSRLGGTKIRSLRRSIGKEGAEYWDDVLSAKLHQMGMATPGKQGAEELFSVNTYLTNWAKLDPAAKRAMFGGSRYTGLRTQLDKLARIVGGLKDVEAMRNFSGTAQQNAYMGLVQGTGPLAGWMAGGPEGAVVGASVTMGMPYALSKLMTNAKFVSWLARGINIPVANYNGMAAHLGRLVAITKVNPEIKDEIKQLLEAFRQVPR